MPITQNILVPPGLWRVKFSKQKESSNHFLIAREFNFSRAARRARGSRALPPQMLNDERIEHVSSVGTQFPGKPLGQIPIDFRSFRFNFSNFRP